MNFKRKEKMWTCWSDTEKGREVVHRQVLRGSEHSAYEDRLRKIELFSLGKRRHLQDLRVAFQ